MSIIRELSAAAITDAVEQLCIEANTQLPADVKAALDKAEAAEHSERKRPAHLPGHRHGLRVCGAGA